MEKQKNQTCKVSTCSAVLVKNLQTFLSTLLNQVLQSRQVAKDAALVEKKVCDQGLFSVDKYK